MTRNELREIIESELVSITELFDVKNHSYGVDDDAFHNFRQSALRIYGDDSRGEMFTVLMTLMDKHLVALVNKGIGDRDFSERLRDIIVYCLIGIAMGADDRNNRRYS
jgi:hypothetical protein